MDLSTWGHTAVDTIRYFNECHNVVGNVATANIFEMLRDSDCVCVREREKLGRWGFHSVDKYWDNSNCRPSYNKDYLTVSGESS